MRYSGIFMCLFICANRSWKVWIRTRRKWDRANEWLTGATQRIIFDTFVLRRAAIRAFDWNVSYTSVLGSSALCHFPFFLVCCKTAQRSCIPYRVREHTSEREDGRRRGIDVLIRMSPAAAENKGATRALRICLFHFCYRRRCARVEKRRAEKLDGCMHELSSVRYHCATMGILFTAAAE